MFDFEEEYKKQLETLVLVEKRSLMQDILLVYTETKKFLKEIKESYQSCQREISKLQGDIVIIDQESRLKSTGKKTPPAYSTLINTYQGNGIIQSLYYYLMHDLMELLNRPNILGRKQQFFIWQALFLVTREAYWEDMNQINGEIEQIEKSCKQNESFIKERRQASIITLQLFIKKKIQEEIMGDSFKNKI